MKRITDRDLEKLAERINLARGLAPEPWTKTAPGKYSANIGTYYIDFAYGAARLVRIVTEGGGVSVVFDYAPRRDLALQLAAYLRALPLELEPEG